MKSILTVLIGLIISFGVEAQGVRTTDDRLDRLVLTMDLKGAEMATLEMRLELGLDEVQQKEVENINKERYTQLLAAEGRYATEPDMLRREMRSINMQSDKALIGLLTDKQMLLFLELDRRQNLRYVSEIGEGE